MHHASDNRSYETELVRVRLTRAYNVGLVFGGYCQRGGSLLVFIPPFDTKFIFMDKVFKVKITEDGLGRYNAHKTVTIFVVADNSHQVINRVLTPDTRSIEIVESFPCLVIK